LKKLIALIVQGLVALGFISKQRAVKIFMRLRPDIVDALTLKALELQGEDIETYQKLAPAWQRGVIRRRSKELEELQRK
jgi:hypothetical protein